MWAVLQCNTYAENGRRGRRMTLDTLRYQAYTAMAFGAETILWACWNGWWEDNAVDTNDVPTATFPLLKAVNGELHRLGTEYMKYRTVKTDVVEGSGTSSGTAFSGVRAVDGSRILVGHMDSRSGTSQRAMFVLACDDPEGANPQPHDIVFTAKGRVATFGGDGAVPAKMNADGTYAVGLKSNRGVLVVVSP